MVASEFSLLIAESESVNQAMHVDRIQYEAVQEAILENLRLYGPTSLEDLGILVEEQLGQDLIWYYSMARSDMEACGQICRVLELGPLIVEIG